MHLPVDYGHRKERTGLSAHTSSDQQAFAFYRLPNATSVNFISGVLKATPDYSIGTLLQEKGFVVAPFDLDGKQTSRLISADQAETLEIAKAGQHPAIKALHLSPPSNSEEWSQNEYLHACRKLVDQLKGNNLIRKAVLSRITHVEAITTNPGKWFEALCNQYPSAFVYFIHLPGEGNWMGATPETLFAAKEGHAKTMSLAGTQHLNSRSVERITWQEKEKEEQQIVTDYIASQLAASDITFTQSEPYTTQAGQIVHLRTDFGMNLSQAQWGKIALALHPTPAVCGLPTQAAKNVIREIEDHDRKYYTGFLGPNMIDEQTHLFVNLRCMEVFDGVVRLYLGGGITASSIPEREWEETNHKARTLLAVIEKMQNFAP